MRSFLKLVEAGIRNGLLFPYYVPPDQEMGDYLLASLRLTVRPKVVLTKYHDFSLS
jgi:hypothetical protein